MELELHVGSIAKKAGVGVQTLHYIMSALISSQSLHDQKRTTVFILAML